MATTKKVMDIAKPEDAKPEIGSKPMIVGHKSMATDPMVREADAAATETVEETGQKQEEKPAPTLEKLAPPSEKQKVLAPLEKSEPEPVVGTEDKKTDTAPVVPVEGAKIVEKQDPLTGSDDVPTEKSAEKKTEEVSADTTEEKKPVIDPVAVEMEKQDDLRKMIASKKYFVSVKQAKKSNPMAKAISVIFIVMAFFGTLFYLVDTDKLDLGFDLPFNIFGKVEQQAAPVATEPVATEPVSPAVSTPAVDETVTYANEAFGVSFDYPTSWGTVTVEQINGYDDQSYETEIPYFLQVSFSKLNDVSVRLINGRAFEGGRGFEGPLASITYFQNFYHEFSYKFIESGKSYSLVRVDNQDVSKTLSNGAVSEEQFTFTLGNDGTTLIMQPNWTKENLNLLPWDEEKQGTTEEAATLDITKLNKKTYYVHNYTSEKILGANATYTWSADALDKTINDQLVALLKSIK